MMPDNPMPSEPLTAAEIAKMRELEKAASEGPWFQSDKPHTGIVYRLEEPDCRGFHVDYGTVTPDADFIAASRAFVPRAIADLERLQSLEQPWVTAERIDKDGWYWWLDDDMEKGTLFLVTIRDGVAATSGLLNVACSFRRGLWQFIPQPTLPQERADADA